MESDTTAQPRTARGGTLDSTEMQQWVIYAHPRDYPNRYVMRRWRIQGATIVPTDDIALADSLQEIRKKLPSGLFRLARFEDDDPCIAEVWL